MDENASYYVFGLNREDEDLVNRLNATKMSAARRELRSFGYQIVGQLERRSEIAKFWLIECPETFACSLEKDPNLNNISRVFRDLDLPYDSLAYFSPSVLSQTEIDEKSLSMSE